MGHRVIVWGTGFVGRLTLKEVIRNPDYEIAAVIVNTPEKVGVDIGTLAGLPPVGLAATDDVDAALALDADAVAYFAQSMHRYPDAIEDHVRALRAGKNVVTVSFVGFVAPTVTLPEPIKEVFETACKEGGSSLFMTGSDPGFLNDVWPATLAGFGGRIDSIRIQQLFDWTSYPDPVLLREMMGFGKPFDDGTPPMATPGAATGAYGGNLRLLAEWLGAELDEIVEMHDRRPTERAYDTGIGRVEAGTNGALRHELLGMVDGRPRVVLEGIARVHPDVAPDWPHGEMATSVYRVTIEGSPRIVSEIQILGEDGDHNTGACLATGMRAVHAIPAVCAAAPGIVEPRDLPIVTGRGSLAAPMA